MPLTSEEKNRILRRVAEIEAQTGAEIVTALAARCDNYPEIPWKAFALGAALGALAVLAEVALAPDWRTWSSLESVAVVLGTGLVCALPTLVWPGWARRFLERGRAEAEARQHAETQFMKHELFGTRGRHGILVLVAEFEHEVVILPDRGVRDRIAAAEWMGVIAHMLPALKRGAPAEAFTQGLAVLERVLRAHGYTRGGGENQLPEHIDGDTKR